MSNHQWTPNSLKEAVKQLRSLNQTEWQTIRDAIKTHQFTDEDLVVKFKISAELVSLISQQLDAADAKALYLEEYTTDPDKPGCFNYILPNWDTGLYLVLVELAGAGVTKEQLIEDYQIHPQRAESIAYWHEPIQINLGYFVN